ncbi:MAG: CRISPR-associated protein [Campylobacter sp.]|nr:CRISPR-associated protein [Campylobacter sp.]
MIRYEIKFFDYWHVSSGLSGGAALDSYVIKDEQNLPFVPGKTIKGLVREMANLQNPELCEKCFGKEGLADDNTAISTCYFSNAILDKTEANEITSQNLSSYLYEVRSSTKLDENGIAEDNSLRSIEVTIPLSLHGEIEAKPEHETLIKNALKMIKRLGLNRNRGLGRCEFIAKEQK